MLGEDKSQIAVLRDLLQKGRDNTDALLKIFQELGEQAVLQKVYALEIKKMDAALTATAEAAEKWEREIRADERERVVQAVLKSPISEDEWKYLDDDKLRKGFANGIFRGLEKTVNAIRQMKEKV